VPARSRARSRTRGLSKKAYTNLAVIAALLVVLAAGALKRYEEHARAAGALTIAADFGVYASMASNLPNAPFQQDPAQVAVFNADPYGFRPEVARGPFVPFFQNDLGLTFLVRASSALFGGGHTPLLTLAWLQMAVSCLDVLLMFWVGRKIGGDGPGLLCAFMYAGLSALVTLSATFPYYYAWMASFAVWNLAFAALVPDFLAGRRLWLPVVWGIFLGFAGMVRSSFIPLGFLAAAFMLLRWRRKAVPAALVLMGCQALIMMPVFVRSYQHFGRVTPPRLVWHTAYVGFGWYENPYAIKWDDAAGYQFAEAKGLKPGGRDWLARYEGLLRDEVLRIRRETPWLWPYNTLRNFFSGLVVFDTPLYLRLKLGFLGISADLPRAHWGIALLLFSGLIYALFRLRGALDWWLLAAAMLQGMYFIASVSLLCPPFLGYNAAWLPTFCVLSALTLYAVFHALFGRFVR